MASLDPLSSMTKKQPGALGPELRDVRIGTQDTSMSYITCCKPCTLIFWNIFSIFFFNFGSPIYLWAIIICSTGNILDSESLTRMPCLFITILNLNGYFPFSWMWNNGALLSDLRTQSNVLLQEREWILSPGDGNKGKGGRRGLKLDKIIYVH